MSNGVTINNGESYLLASDQKIYTVIGDHPSILNAYLLQVWPFGGATYQCYLPTHVLGSMIANGLATRVN